MKILDYSKLYFEKRMLRILLLGFMSGFPWVLIGSALSLWLKENELSRSAIGWAGLIFGVYAINFLWAPVVDRLRIPFLSKKIGHRKSWIISMQVSILFSLSILNSNSMKELKLQNSCISLKMLAVRCFGYSTLTNLFSFRNI